MLTALGKLDTLTAEMKTVIRFRVQFMEKLEKKLLKSFIQFYIKSNAVHIFSQASFCFKDWLYQWLHSYAEITVRPSTYISYEGYIYNHIIPELGNLLVQQITPVIIQSFYNQKFESGRTDGNGGLSPKTIRNLHNMLHQSLEQAKINGIIFSNPTDNASIPKQEKKEMRVLSTYEQSALIGVLHLHRLGFAIMFDLATGLRIGELCALKWSDVNFNKRTVKISRTLQRIKKSMSAQINGENTTAILEGNVKTNSGFREIPLPDKIFNLLIQHQQNQVAEMNPAWMHLSKQRLHFCHAIWHLC